jgi:MoxR-like ATPases
MQINVDYPDREAERDMLLATTGTATQSAASTLTTKDLMTARHVVRALPVGEQVVEAILDLVRLGRPQDSSLADVSKHVAWGPGPRAAQALMLASRAKALLEGRLSPSLDDVSALARPVLQHRMALSFGARADGLVLDDVIDRMVTTVLS